MFISFLHGLKIGKQQVNSECKFPDTADGGICHNTSDIWYIHDQYMYRIYYQTHMTLVTDVVSRGRITVQLTRKILVQK